MAHLTPRTTKLSIPEDPDSDFYQCVSKIRCNGVEVTCEKVGSKYEYVSGSTLIPIGKNIPSWLVRPRLWSKMNPVSVKLESVEKD